MSGWDLPALFCGSRTLSCVDPRSAMVVMGSFGFVENSGASFAQVGLDECKDRRATQISNVKYAGVGETGMAPSGERESEILTA